MHLRGPARRRGRRHEEHLEVGPPRRLARRRGHGALAATAFLVQLLLPGLAAVAARHERARHPLDEAHGAVWIARAHALLERVEQPQPGEGLQGLEGTQPLEALGAFRLGPRGSRGAALRSPGLRRLAEIAPAIHAGGGDGEEVVHVCGGGGGGMGGHGVGSRRGSSGNWLHGDASCAGGREGGAQRSKRTEACTRLAEPSSSSNVSRDPYRYSMPVQARSQNCQMKLAAA
jgi:hypothetical protein